MALSHIPFAVIGTNAVNVLMTVIAVGGPFSCVFLNNSKDVNATRPAANVV